MILLVRPKYLEFVESPDLPEGFAPRGTPIYVDPNLPEKDEEGRPIFAFRVSAKEIHYWRGEPIALPPELK
jgi:hypothetical protein